MSPGFRPRWMDCDEPGWNPDSRRDSTAEPEQASDRMALALPSECIVYPIRYTMHVNAEGSERDRKSASLLDGKTESDTPLVLTTMTEESSTFILVSFDDDSYLIIDERSSGFADRARIGRRIRPHRARRIRRRGYPPALAFRANRPRIVLSRV